MDGTRDALRRTGPLSAPLLALACFLAPPVQPARTAAGRRAPRAGQPARAPGTRRGLAQANPRGLGRCGHRGGGAIILNHETGTLINPANNGLGTASPGSSLSGGGTTANSKRWKLPLGVKTQPGVGDGPAQERAGHAPLPAVACTPTPKPAVTTSAPAGGPTATPTPTVTGTATGTPTAQPTGSATATPPTPTTSPATGGTATATAAAHVPAV